MSVAQIEKFIVAAMMARRTCGVLPSPPKAGSGLLGSSVICNSPYVKQIIASGRYPYFARSFNEGITPDPERDFAFGLDCLLAGLAANLPPADLAQASETTSYPRQA